MQLFSRNKALIAASLVAMGGLAACGDDVTVPVAPEPQPDPVVVTMTPPNATLNIGETFDFAVAITGGKPTPTLQSCTSSSSTIATAAVSGNACRVSAQAPGNVSVLATASNGQTASASVSVNALPPAAAGMTITPNTVALARGQTSTVAASLNGGRPGATLGGLSQASSNANVATATISGNNITITGVAPGTATITVTGTASGAGSSNATVSAQIGVVVSEAPAAITSLTVQPTSLAMAVGSTNTITASVVQPAGAPAAVVSYSSSASTIASVNPSTGLVTALAPGNATITVTATSTGSATLSAATLTQLVPVTVAPIANLTIANIRQGPTVTSYDNSINQEGLIVANNPQVNQPVDITNTRDQIQVTINLETNGQRVDSVVAYIADQNGQNRRSAARQTFTNGNANTSVIEFLINTADFTVNWTTGAVDVLYPNGLRVLSASVWTTGPNGVVTEIQNAANNRQTLNFNNLDSWAMRYVAPTRVAQGGSGSNSNLNWWGGPSTPGHGTWNIAPVFYTPGRTVKTVTTQMSVIGDNGAGSLNHLNGFGAAANVCGTITYTDAGNPRPWLTTFGYQNLPTNAVNCLGFEHPVSVNGLFDMRNLPTLFAVIDNNNNPGPFVRRLNGYRTSASVVQPAPLRLDYQVPTVTVNVNPQVTGAEAGWVNGSYSFITATGESDGGVGLPNPLGQTYTWTGCATGNGGTNVPFDGLVKPKGATGEIPECSNDFLGGALLNGPYTVTATQADVLGNVGQGTSPKFGVDKTEPELTFIDQATLGTSIAAVSRQGLVISTGQDSVFDAVTTTYTSTAGINNGGVAVNSTNAHFGARYRDERAGFQQNNHGSRSITRWAPAASPLLSNVSVSSEVLGTAWRTLNFDGNLGVGPLAQESVVDAGDPTFRRDSVSIWGGAAGSLTATSPGYYFYRITVIDRAGNSRTINRTAAIDITSPQVTGVQIPAVLTGGTQHTFIPTGSDDLEANDGDLFLNYPTMALAGDGVADPTTITDQNGRLRFRRNWFTDWHAPWLGASRNVTVVNSDNLLSTPFGPGAALSSNGLTLPIGFYQRLEVVRVAGAQEDQGPHGRPAITRMPSQPNLALIPGHTGAYNSLNAFKPTQLGVYAFDIRSYSFNASTAVSFPERGMSSMQNPAGESAYLENLFAANIAQPTQINFWGTRDVDPTTAGTQNLWSWYCFNFVSSTLECRAETGTNVVNSPFTRVDYYRWNATANAGLTVPDAAATAGQWIYIGSVTANVPTNPIIQDQGVTRFWRFRFQFSGFGLTNNHASNTEAPLATGNRVRAIGVDANGNAISTLTFTL
jgi:uncharacterized protein YjdB